MSNVILTTRALLVMISRAVRVPYYFIYLCYILLHDVCYLLFQLMIIFSAYISMKRSLDRIFMIIDKNFPLYIESFAPDFVFE